MAAARAGAGESKGEVNMLSSGWVAASRRAARPFLKHVSGMAVNASCAALP